MSVHLVPKPQQRNGMLTGAATIPLPSRRAPSRSGWSRQSVFRRSGKKMHVQTRIVFRGTSQHLNHLLFPTPCSPLENGLFFTYIKPSGLTQFDILQPQPGHREKGVCRRQALVATIVFSRCLVFSTAMPPIYCTYTR